MGRSRFFISQEELECLTFAKWSEMFHAYRTIWNFEAKKSLYKDIEEEQKEYQLFHQPIADINKL
jgi:hypothetical protein